jgi:1-acyl-sn-glycerol-3-phosphate acyltransferase
MPLSDAPMTKIRPFKKFLSKACLPVIPGTLRGTRAILRSDQWLPRRAPISVEIGAPIQPTGTTFADILQLRDRVRKEILAHCGEPDLNELVKPPPQPQAQYRDPSKDQEARHASGR